MTNYLSQNWLLNRRHVLRGLGVSMALPLFESATSDAPEVLAIAEAIRREASTPAAQLVAALFRVRQGRISLSASPPPWAPPWWSCPW